MALKTGLETNVDSLGGFKSPQLVDVTDVASTKVNFGVQTLTAEKYSCIAIGEGIVLVGAAEEVRVYDFEGNLIKTLTSPDDGNTTAEPNPEFGAQIQCNDGLVGILQPKTGVADVDPGYETRQPKLFLYDGALNYIRTLDIPPGFFIARTTDAGGLDSSFAMDQNRIIFGSNFIASDTTAGVGSVINGVATLYDYEGNILVEDLIEHNGLNIWDSSGSNLDYLLLDTGRSNFGEYVDLGFDRIAVSAHWVDSYKATNPNTGGSTSRLINGRVFLFDLNGNLLKVIEKPDFLWEDYSSSTARGYAYFGEQVKISGNKIFIMAAEHKVKNETFSETGELDKAGLVFVYDINGNLLWYWGIDFSQTFRRIPATTTFATMQDAKMCVYGDYVLIKVREPIASNTSAIHHVLHLYDIYGNFITKICDEFTAQNEGVRLGRNPSQIGTHDRANHSMGFGKVAVLTTDTGQEGTIYDITKTYSGYAERSVARKASSTSQ